MTETPLPELELARGDALFLNLDGTVAELGPDPDAIRIPEETVSALRGLSGALDAAIVFLSGRDVRDLARRTPGFVWRAGGHGLEIVGPGAEIPAPPDSLPGDVLEPLQKVAAQHEGVWLELKGPVSALHYRAAPDAEEACLAAGAAAVEIGEDLVMQPGKMVVEVKPARANKGEALRRICELPEFSGRRPVMIGDDATDEDAMRAAREVQGIGVRVGDGETVATYRAPDPEAVRAWIARQAERLAS